MLRNKIIGLLSTTAVALCVISEPISSADATPPRLKGGSTSSNSSAPSTPRSPLSTEYKSQRGALLARKRSETYAKLKEMANSGDVVAQAALQAGGEEQAIEKYNDEVRREELLRSLSSSPSGQGTSGGLYPGGASFPSKQELEEMGRSQLKGVYQSALDTFNSLRISASVKKSEATDRWKTDDYIDAIEDLHRRIKGASVHSAPASSYAASGGKIVHDAGEDPVVAAQKKYDEIGLLINGLQGKIDRKEGTDQDRRKWGIEVEKYSLELEELFKIINAAEIKRKEEEERKRKAKEAAEAERIKEERKAEYRKKQAEEARLDKEAHDALSAAAGVSPLKTFILLPKADFLAQLTLKGNFKTLANTIGEAIRVETDVNLLKALRHKLTQVSIEDIKKPTKVLDEKTQRENERKYSEMVSSFNNAVGMLNESLLGNNAISGKSTSLPSTKAKGVKTTQEEQDDYQYFIQYYRDLPNNSFDKQKIDQSVTINTLMGGLLAEAKFKVAYDLVTKLELLMNGIGGSSTTLQELRALKAAVKMGAVRLDLNHIDIGKIVGKIEEIMSNIERGSTKQSPPTIDRSKSQEAYYLSKFPNYGKRAEREKAEKEKAEKEKAEKEKAKAAATLSAAEKTEAERVEAEKQKKAAEIAEKRRIQKAEAERKALAGGVPADAAMIAQVKSTLEGLGVKSDVAVAAVNAMAENDAKTSKPKQKAGKLAAIKGVLFEKGVIDGSPFAFAPYEKAIKDIVK